MMSLKFISFFITRRNIMTNLRSTSVMPSTLDPKGPEALFTVMRGLLYVDCKSLLSPVCNSRQYRESGVLL